MEGCVWKDVCGGMCAEGGIDCKERKKGGRGFVRLREESLTM